jgi:NADH-quinone oxidoreductase subunit K
MIEMFSLAAASVLTAAGVYGLITRRNLAFAVLSIELILNAGILLFVLTAPGFIDAADAVSAALILLAVGASEVAVGFAISVYIARHHRSSDLLKIGDLGGKVGSD